MQLPAQEAVAPTQDLINNALSHRTELAEARINLTNQEISNKAIRSSLLPSLDLFAYYGGSGVGGAQNPANLCVNQPIAEQSQGFCSGPNPNPPGGSTVTLPVAPTTSYGGTLNQQVNSTAPDKGVGLTLSIPLRNRVAQATQIRSELEYRQAQMRLQQIENQIRIEVRNAQFAVQQNRASVESAEAAVALARQSLDAEQKKLNLGASTSTLVLQNQSALATAQSTRVSAMAAYEKARVELDRATGDLLVSTGIQIADAERGQVTNQPHVPDVTSRKDLPPASLDYAPAPAPVPPQPQ
jgi:outer membrane protein TolC